MKKLPGESLRDFGNAIEDVYRRAYQENPEIVEENAIKSFLDKCKQLRNFDSQWNGSDPRHFKKQFWMQCKRLTNWGKGISKGK